MAQLLVSVRSATEARAAWLGGAAVIDIKEPSRGPLGRAEAAVWRGVRAVVPQAIPVSVALGELVDLDTDPLPCADLAGLAFVKAGPAGTGDLTGWLRHWDRLGQQVPASPGRVAVAYLDARAADAPEPAAILAAAAGELPGCVGVLIDTWDKARRIALDPTPAWREQIRAVQRAGRFVALAGGLDRDRFAALRGLGPDLFAVRGAACTRGEREGAVQRDRVARLVAALGGGQDASGGRQVVL